MVSERAKGVVRIRGKHEKRPSVSQEARAEKIKSIAVEIFKAVIAGLIAEAITEIFFR